MQLQAGTRTLLLALALSALTLAATGCGDDEQDESGQVAFTAERSAFPAPDGRTLEELISGAAESDLVVAPAGQVFAEGPNRFGFGVFTVDREPVTDAAVALYAARPGKQAQGPYPATVEPLDPAPGFRSESTSTDPDAAKVLYRAELDLDHEGEWRIVAMIDGPDGPEYSVIPSAVVGQFPGVPGEGDRAPLVHTPTSDDVGGNLAAIDTRQPPSTMHDVDLADVLGEKPVVLLFATPALCTSRVCGPVVDIAEQVKSERPDDAAFIHMEIYRDNKVDEGLRPQVDAYELPSEPWLFVIDREGRIEAAIEGAFSEIELNEALDRVAG
jgi:hypothetical protein